MISLIHLGLCLWRRPEQDVSVCGPYRFQFAHFARSLVVHKRRSRKQCRILVIFFHQHIPVISLILYHCRRIPLTATLYGRQRTLQIILCRNLALVRIHQIRFRYSAYHILTDVQRTSCGMTCPPANQCIIVGCRMSDFPINLRDIVIYPAIVYPQKHVGIQVIVVLQSVCFTSIRVILLVTINTER